MENFLKFDAIDTNEGLAFIGYLIGWVLLTMLVVVAVYIIRAQLSSLAQIGLLLLFLGINALIPLYLAVPAFLLMLAVGVFFLRHKSSIRKPRE
jgi:glycerol-3-phosphate acyltransferase PlsY